MNILYAVVASLTLYRIYQSVKDRRKTTRLVGPSSESLFFGVAKMLMESQNPATHYAKWIDQYGGAFRIAGPLQAERIVISDPKAVGHICALDSLKYNQTPVAVAILSSIVGAKNIACAIGEEHKRQRKLLNPVFSSTAIKSCYRTFLETAYKVKASWDSMLELSSSDEILVDVSEPIERLALDNIGLAILSYNFGSLDGDNSPVTRSLQSLAGLKPTPVAVIVTLLAEVFPSLLKLPMPRTTLITEFSKNMGIVSDNLIRKAAGNDDVESSALGTLLKMDSSALSREELEIHIKSFIFAGNETTAVMLKWCLIELTKRQDTQEALRKELLSLAFADPTYEELSNGLPYLEAVVREVLRLHPIAENLRTALEDDVIPLSRPVRTASGTLTNKITVAKGTTIVMPLPGIHNSRTFWGETATEFRPERWLLEDGIPTAAQEYAGYHHLLTFLDGPRSCLGKVFAVIQVKAVLAVLLRSYRFIPRDGPETKYMMGFRLVPHPMVVDQEGGRLPMRIMRVE